MNPVSPLRAPFDKPSVLIGALTAPDPFGASYDEGKSVVYQPDGKIVMAGSFAENNTGGVVLLRRNSDGTPDGTFGSGGVVYSTITNSYRSSAVIARQSDGKMKMTAFRTFDPVDHKKAFTIPGFPK